MSAPDVSVVVLSYDRPAMLREALASIEAQRRPPGEIVVVDNPSPSSPAVDAVMADFPRARLVRPARNLGFAGGINRGIAEARGTWVHLTEDDIILEPECLERLAAHAASRPDCGIATALMLNRGAGTVRFAGARLRLGGVFRQEIVGGIAPEAVPPEPAVVDFAPGACMFARRSLLDELGGFRAEFFMYYEDAELCLRVRRRGLRIHLVPAARVRHIEPAPGPAPAAVEFHKIKNLAALYALHAPLRVLPEFALRYGAWTPLRTLPRDPAQAARLLRGFAWALLRLPRLWRERRALGR